MWVWDPERSAPTCTFDDLWGSDDNGIVEIVKGRVTHEADAARLLHGVHLQSQVHVVRERPYERPSVEGVRIREDRAAERTGWTSRRYEDALVAKYAHLPEVKRIHGGRKVLKMIKKGTQVIVVQKEKRRRVEGNVVRHSRPGTTKFMDDKVKAIVRTVD